MSKKKHNEPPRQQADDVYRDHSEQQFEKQIDLEEQAAKQKQLGKWSGLRAWHLANTIYLHLQSMKDNHEFMVDVVEDLFAAAEEGHKHSLAMPNCIRLARVILDAPDFDYGKPEDFILGAYTELTQLGLYFTDKPSRRVLEPAIAQWYRANGHKYANRAEAVRSYCDLHGGIYQSLYDQLTNNMRKQNKPVNERTKSL